MRKTLFGLLALLPFAANAQTSATQAAQNPPKESAAAVKPVTTTPAPSSAELTRLEPTEADLKKAREEREKRVATQDKNSEFVDKRGTRIQTFTDQNNHLTSVKVTPSTTEIPYTMKNQANRPIQNGPTSNTHSTLSTPTFIELKW